MILLSLLSLLLFSVPIFVTFGAFFAAEYEKILSCGFHCGEPGGGLGSGGSAGTPGWSSVVGDLYCQKAHGITPSPGNYIFNPNQWGDPDNTGALCLNFTSNGNSPEGYAASFAATWNYPMGPENRPVHAFPNALIQSDNMPIQLSALSGLSLDVQWTYQTGALTPQQTALDNAAVTAAQLNANVCVDMFLATDEGNAESTEDSDYEVMVWLGQFGDSVQPLGYGGAPLDTRLIEGTTFELYSDANQFGQQTFTWLASAPTPQFKGDISPLLQGLSGNKGPGPQDYLGYVAFGSETFYAMQNVTFYVPKLDLEVKKA